MKLRAAGRDWRGRRGIDRRRVMAGLAAAAAALALTACSIPSKVYTFRYKLTLEALVNGEVRRGFSVVEQSVQQRNPVTVTPWIKGEALYLDLTPHCRPLVALLRERDMATDTVRQRGVRLGPGVGNLETLYGLPRMKMKQHGKGYLGATLEGWDEFARQRGPRDLQPAQLPMLVTFGDIDDPKTVTAVDAENPGAALGCDFKWQRITIEVTDDPITTGIERKLGWLASLYPNALDGRRYETIDAENRLANSLSASTFSTEIGK